MAKKKFEGVAAAFEANSGGLLNAASRNASIKKSSVYRIPRGQIVAHEMETTIYPDMAPEAKPDAKLYALAHAIKQGGLNAPLRVYALDDGRYRLLGGHRRLAANNLAVEELGYEDGEEVPCVIVEPPSAARPFEATEALIEDNLHRDKSDYTRMQEIVQMYACGEARRELGETIVQIRDFVKERLGVGDTEITRCKKIASSLAPELMQKFKEELIPATVAYEVARCDPEVQQYIIERWHGETPLSLPGLAAYVGEYEAAHKETAPKGESATKKAPVAPTPKSISEGLSFLSTEVERVERRLSSPAAAQLGKRAVNQILKKIQKYNSALLTLQSELESLGLFDTEEA